MLYARDFSCIHVHCIQCGSLRHVTLPKVGDKVSHVVYKAFRNCPHLYRCLDQHTQTHKHTHTGYINVCSTSTCTMYIHEYKSLWVAYFMLKIYSEIMLTVFGKGKSVSGSCDSVLRSCDPCVANQTSHWAVLAWNMRESSCSCGCPM